MPDHYFWLSDAQFARLQPLLPNKVHGVPRVDDRKVISGISHALTPLRGCFRSAFHPSRKLGRGRMPDHRPR